MAYKITKYRGKHKIKDTKTGESAEIDIKKFLNGGPGDKDKDKKLSKQQVRDVNDATGIEFTDQGANTLFVNPDELAAMQENIPQLDFGRYKDVGYFNAKYSNGEYTLSPTKNNPGNAAKYKEYLDYLQKLNPDVKINRRGHANGYLPFGQRLEYGGTIEIYADGGKKDKEKEYKELKEFVEKARQAIGTNDSETLKNLRLDKPYNSNDLARDFSRLQELRKDLGYGVKEEAAILFPHIGQQMRGAVNNMLGTHLEHGGYLPKYADGTEFDCPPGDFACEERKRLMKERQVAIDDTAVGRSTVKPVDPSRVQQQPVSVLEPKTLNDLYNQVGFSNGITDENSVARDKVSSVNAGIKAQPGTIDYNAIQAPDISASLKDRMNQLEADSVEQDQSKDFTIFNPYAGVDIPTAAYTLGQSIKNKDTLGIIGSGLKVATGLGRNVVSGLGQANRYNQVMEDYYKDQRDNRNPVQYFEKGGRKEEDEELATGEYVTGIDNENIHPYNAEVEDGEYLQTNEGDIAEVVGKKHAQGGEKIQMEEDDRVLSDKLKIGSKVAKELSEKYDLKLKAKDTYSTVLDKFKRKSKLGDLIDEEAEIIKKISEQDKVEDADTKAFNLEVLSKKQDEIAEKKSPLEEQRKAMFDELFDIQEDSKPKSKEDEQEDTEENEFQYGGNFEALAKEYNIPVERAKELVQQFANGGDKKGAAKREVRPGQSETDKGFFGNVTPEEYRDFVRRNSSWFDFRGFDPRNSKDVARLQTAYNDRTTGNKVRVDGKFGEQTASLFLSPDLQSQPISFKNPTITADMSMYKSPAVQQGDSKDFPILDEEDIKRRNSGLAGMYLFPPDSPLPPSSLQGTIKPERRFDRVKPTEIVVEPYLQDIRDREQAQVQSLEGLSPNVRAAVLANMRANNQSQESNIRNQIDTQNLQSQERANYTNAQIQRMEENASEADRLAYEQRQYRAQALTDNDLNNYYNQLQAINKQRFMDIHNLNLINATNEDVYFDGQTYRRKNSDQDILRRIKI